MSDKKGPILDIESTLKDIVQNYFDAQQKKGVGEVGENLEVVGSLIRRLRTEQRLSQKELANLAGVSIGPVLQLGKN